MNVLQTRPTRFRTLYPAVFSRRCIGSFRILTPCPRLRECITRRPRFVRNSFISIRAVDSTEASMAEEKNSTQSTSRVIVVAVDETEESVKALKWTLDNFHREGDTLHLLHVIPFVHQQIMTSTVYYTPPIPDPEISEQLYENAEEVVKETFIPVLEEKKVKYEVDMVQEKGSETIGEAVCHAASDVDACAVVVAAHKKHWLQLWLMGSSSREIAGKAPIPVIVFHG
eukprot:g4456.t1